MTAVTGNIQPPEQLSITICPSKWSPRPPANTWRRLSGYCHSPMRLRRRSLNLLPSSLPEQARRSASAVLQYGLERPAVSVVHRSPLKRAPLCCGGTSDRICTGKLEAPPGFEPGMEGFCRPTPRHHQNSNSGWLGACNHGRSCLQHRSPAGARTPPTRSSRRTHKNSS